MSNSVNWYPKGSCFHFLLCAIIVRWRKESALEEVFTMSIEEMKARLRSLLHQRDMLSYERDSLELFDLMEEVETEIQELQNKLRKIA